MRSLKSVFTKAVFTALLVLALGSIAQAKSAPAFDRIAWKAQQLLNDGYLSSPKEIIRAKAGKAAPAVTVSAPHPNSHEARVNRELARLTFGQAAEPKKANQYAGMLQAAISDVNSSKGQPVEGRYVHPNPIKGEVYAKAYDEMCRKLDGLFTKDTSKALSGGLRTPPKKVQEWIEKYSKIFGVPVPLIQEIMWRESRFQHFRKDGSVVRNPKSGATGCMQLMLATAAGLGVDPFDHEQNIKGGVKYLGQGLKKYNGNVLLTAARYLGGPGYAAKVAARGISDRSEEGMYIHGTARSVGNITVEPQLASLKK